MSHQRFIIIFEGRTGSSYVVSCLNSHPDILCYPEILSKKTWPQQQTILTTFVKGKSILPHNPYALHKSYFHHNNIEKETILTFGFKAKLHQIAHLNAFYDFIHKHHFKLVYLKRKNVIKSIISEFNAKKLKQKHGTYNAERKNQIQGKIHIPPHAFITSLNQRLLSEAAHETFYNACHLSKHMFYYEDLMASKTHFFQQLLSYLDIRPLKLKGKFYKNTPSSIADALQNYKEIKKIIKGTSFETHFGD